MPKDSLLRFLNAGYYPQPIQVLFHVLARKADKDDSFSEIGFGGARGGSKTHSVFAGTMIDDCQLYPELNVLFLRKKAGSATESIDVLTRKILKRVKHKQVHGLITLPNGSRMRIGHFQYERDIDQYLSLEYDCIIIEQAEQLTPAKLVDIGTVNRTSRTDYNPRMYLTWNWGGVGHSYLKKKFYLPFLNNSETTTRFIPATVNDNKMVNKGYRQKLEELTGWKRKAWLDGSPDIMAGQFFTTFNSAIHVKSVKDFPIYLDAEKTKLNPKAEFWASFDYGYGHYTACHLFMEYDGITYVLAEYGERKKGVAYHAKNIIEMLKRFGLTVSDLSAFVAGADVFAQRGAKNAETIADQYAEFGINLRPANTDRINGAAQILKMLGDTEQNLEPTVFFSSDCARLIETLPMLEHDPKRPEDVLKIDCDENGNGGDDFYDDFRYGVNRNNSVGVF